MSPPTSSQGTHFLSRKWTAVGTERWAACTLTAPTLPLRPWPISVGSSGEAGSARSLAGTVPFYRTWGTRVSDLPQQPSVSRGSSIRTSAAPHLAEDGPREPLKTGRSLATLTEFLWLEPWPPTAHTSRGVTGGRPGTSDRDGARAAGVREPRNLKSRLYALKSAGSSGGANSASSGGL